MRKRMMLRYSILHRVTYAPKRVGKKKKQSTAGNNETRILGLDRLLSLDRVRPLEAQLLPHS